MVEAGFYVGALLDYSTPASSSVQTTITFAIGRPVAQRRKKS